MSHMCWRLHLAVQWHFHCISISWFFELAFIILFCISEVLSSEAFCCARNAFHSLSIASAAAAQFLELKTHNALTLFQSFFAFLHALVLFFFSAELKWLEHMRAHHRSAQRWDYFIVQWVISLTTFQTNEARAREPILLSFFFSLLLSQLYIPSVRWRESNKVK